MPTVCKEHCHALHRGIASIIVHGRTHSYSLPDCPSPTDEFIPYYIAVSARNEAGEGPSVVTIAFTREGSELYLRSCPVVSWTTGQYVCFMYNNVV